MYFIDKQNEYLFYLLELDTSSRMYKLRITNSHYLNKTLAKEWFENIRSIISANKNHPKFRDGLFVLNKLYNSMIER